MGRCRQTGLRPFETSCGAVDERRELLEVLARDAVEDWHGANLAAHECLRDRLVKGFACTAATRARPKATRRSVARAAAAATRKGPRAERVPRAWLPPSELIESWSSLQSVTASALVMRGLLVRGSCPTGTPCTPPLPMHVCTRFFSEICARTEAQAHRTRVRVEGE